MVEAVYSDADLLCPHRPLSWAQLTGAGISVAAGAGAALIAATRTKKYMQKANQEFFEPRGLRASIRNYDELISKLGLGYTGQAAQSSLP